MSGPKTRSFSEETQLRKLLVDVTDLVLEMKEEQRKNNVLLKGRLDDIDAELRLVRRDSRAAATKSTSAAMLAADALDKVNDLHQKVIGSADGLGKRLHDLEQKRSQSAAGGGSTRRPTR